MVMGVAHRVPDPVDPRSLKEALEAQTPSCIWESVPMPLFVPIKLTKDRFLRVDRLLNGEERMPVRLKQIITVVDEIQRDWESYD